MWVCLLHLNTYRVAEVEVPPATAFAAGLTECLLLHIVRYRCLGVYQKLVPRSSSLQIWKALADHADAPGALEAVAARESDKPMTKSLASMELCGN